MFDIVRAWKDPDYRAECERTVAHPAGIVEFDEADLASLNGGAPGTYNPTSDYGCYTVKQTFCNGTCALFGTMGCCP